VQSAVSATLRSLERELGTTLVARTTHTVELTDTGRLFLPEARRTLAAAQQARHVIDEVRGGMRGSLRLGVTLVDRFADVTPARLISRFAAEYPRIEVLTRTGASAEHADALRRGRLDLAYLAVQQQDATGLRLLPLLTETFGLIVPKGHRLAARKKVSLADVADEPFVETIPSWGSRIAIDDAFRRAGVSRRIAYEMADNMGVLDFVRHGLGVAVGPSLLLGPDLASVPIAEHAPRFTISLACTDQSPGMPTQAMMRMAEQLATAGPADATGR